MVLALAPLTDYACEAVLVLVMIDLVSWDCNFTALVAHDWFMRANLAVLLDIADMWLLSAFAWAGCEGLGAVLLDMWLKLIQWDVSLRAVVGTSKGRVL